MRSVIESITLKFPPARHSTTIERGLVEVHMPRIGPTVVIAGANGSGKSRLLNLVAQIAPQEARSPHSEHRNIIEGFKFGTPNPIRVMHVPAGLPQMQPAGHATMQQLRSARHQLSKDATNFGANLSIALQMAEALVRDLLGTEITSLPLTEEERSARRLRWDRFTTLISASLGVDLGFDEDQHLTIDGLLADEAYNRFSDGQKKLFSFLVSLTGNSARDLDQVVIFDEPETHLHPQAAIQMLRAIQDVLKNGQLWIATHSIPLIAGLGLENVWYAEAGSISYGGRKSEIVINSLLGGSDNLTALRDAISESDRVAIARFSAECLLVPPVAPPANTEDPQFQQLAAAVSRFADEREKLNILDWGAGGGRLKVWLAQTNSVFQERINYFGFEPSQGGIAAFVENVERAIGDARQYITDDIGELITRSAAIGGYDVVLLSNVLHEIDVADWKQTFLRIEKCLSPTGRLLIIEDGEIPIGELPTPTGFLMVDKAACVELFSATPDTIEEIQPKKLAHQGRLRCYVIPKHLLGRIDDGTIIRCLEHIRDTALDKVAKQRSIHFAQPQAVPSYSEGHLYALNMLQYANASLALKSLHGSRE